MKQPSFLAKRAQTASELAIFGAIFIFVLGLIIRYAVNFNYIQNQSLVAMRLAMRQSFLGGESGNNARNFATVLFIEDRKDPSLGERYGAMSRNPYVVSGSGAFTKNLFMGTDWGVTANIPLMDMFINGKHFSFTTAAFKTYILLPDTYPPCPHPDSGSNILCYRAQDWDAACTAQSGETKTGLYQPRGCPIFYKRVPNIPGSDYDPNPVHPEVRFDLDRCGDDNVPSGMWGNFYWQWYPVDASSAKFKPGQSFSYDVDGDLKEETILQVYSNPNVSAALGKLPPPEMGPCSSPDVAVLEVNVLDYQEGDIDLTYNTWDEKGMPTPATGCNPPAKPKPRPGLQNESVFYAGVANPDKDFDAYFTIEEGKLYAHHGDEKRYVRNVTRHDKVDVIERKIQLSNNTGRICSSHAPNKDMGIEACAVSKGGCEKSNNIYKTCFDEEALVLYVRSRLSDQVGRKWITDVSGDQMPLK